MVVIVFVVAVVGIAGWVLVVVLSGGVRGVRRRVTSVGRRWWVMSVRQAAIVKAASVRRTRAARLKVYEKTVAAGLREVFTHDGDIRALQEEKAARLAEVAARFDTRIAQAEQRRNEALAHLRALGETPTSLAEATDLKVREVSRRLAAAKAAQAAKTAGADTSDASASDDSPTATTPSSGAAACVDPGAGACEDPGAGSDTVREQDADAADRADDAACDVTDGQTRSDTVRDEARPAITRERTGGPGREPNAEVAVPVSAPPTGATATADSSPGPAPQVADGATGPEGTGEEKPRAAPPPATGRWRTAVTEPLF